MNEIIELLKKHRSYRNFDPHFKIPEQEVEQIIDAAKQAPSWMNGQHYSIIEISDRELRQKVFEALPNQKHIMDCSRFLVFIMDLYRIVLAGKINHMELTEVDTLQTLIIATTDVGICAQNALIAAESLGYGTCYIGSIRGIADELIAWLKLPKYTFPVVGLCIGKPIVEMKVKPRLPDSVTFFKNEYRVNEIQEGILQYQQTMLEFAEQRETFTWTEKFARFYSNAYAEKNIFTLKKQGLIK